MTKRGRDFRERNQDEVALKHSGMRHLKFGRFNGCVVVEKNIQIDETRAFREEFFATHQRFDTAERGEELRGGKLGVCFEDGIQKPGLVEVIERLCFVKAGDSLHLHAGFFEAANRFTQIVFPVTNIGTQREIHLGHDGAYFMPKRRPKREIMERASGSLKTRLTAKKTMA
jgi:hypothetical protein